MEDKHFNLTTEPWIKVLEIDSGAPKTVSLIDLFTNANQYLQLAGEMKTQDLVIMRLLLAVLNTVYSRFDANNTPYDWVDVDPETYLVKAPVDDDAYEEDDLLDTWQQLYDDGRFSEIVVDYLQKNNQKFDFFGEQPFYQVTRNEYDNLVPENKKVAKGTGTVAIRQVNRQISESSNTPAIFTPKSGSLKDQVTLPELVRWLITYQNYTGVSDKSTIASDDIIHKSAGWMFGLNPVYAQGTNIFDTLMLNLILVAEDHYQVQNPVWEYDHIGNYIDERRKQLQPKNLAALYTTWSRILHIEWQDGVPQIFSAGIPMFANQNAFIEPMTIWKKGKDKTTGDDVFIPKVKKLDSMNVSMWRNFGEYVSVDGSNSDQDAGIVAWLRELKSEKMVNQDLEISLFSATFIGDGKSFSQLPAAEVIDDMVIDADVLFDANPDNTIQWPKRIQDMIELTQKVGNLYRSFVKSIAKIRNFNSKESKNFANQIVGRFYDRLNEPFKQWLASLTNNDNRDVKSNEWKKNLRVIVTDCVHELMKQNSPRDIQGKIKNGKVINIFTAENQLQGKIYNLLDLKKGDSNGLRSSKSDGKDH